MNGTPRPYAVAIGMAGGALLACACSSEPDDGTQGSGGLPPYGYETGGTQTTGGTSTSTATGTTGGSPLGGTGGTGLPLGGTGGMASGGTGAMASGGTGATASGGTGGMASGGTGATASGGTGAAASGGTGATGGTGGVAATFAWPEAYNPSGLSNPPNGEHRGNRDCMECHDENGRTQLLFGGTIYQAGGTTGAANVQVGISDGVNTYTTYSGQNGTFWIESSAGSLDWNSAVVAIRNSSGEILKSAAEEVGAGCNDCHGGGSVLVAP